MGRWSFLVILVLILVGCGGEDEDSEGVASPSATPAPTSVLSGYSGPLLNTPNPDSHAEDCSMDDPDGACGVSVIDIEENALPLPLVMQDVAGVIMGVPEGFDLLDGSADEVIIEAADDEAFPGGFFVVVGHGTADEVDRLLNRYVGLDYDRRAEFQNTAGTLNGYRLPNGNSGMVAIVELDEGGDSYLMMQGIVGAGYWPQYEATFIEMALSVELPSS